MSRPWMLAGLFLLWTSVVAQQTPSLIRVGEAWQFFKAATEPAGQPLDWTKPGYLASPDWLMGRSGIGTYVAGRDAENVLLFDRNYNYVAVCFRREFQVDDPQSIRMLTLRMDYQEGFIAYLNGTEVLRVGLLGQAGTPVSVGTLAATRTTIRPVEFLLNPAAIGLLRPGTNTLALQVHTDRVGPGFPASSFSGDLLCVPELLANFQRGPFIQNVSAESAHVLWKTPLPATGSVAFGATSDQLSQSAPVLVASLQQDAVLTGLKPDTRYFYQVRALVNGLELVSPIASFKTLKASGDVHFCVLGDTGSGAEPQYKVAELLQSWDPELVIHCGDILYASFDPYRVDTRCLSVYGPQMRSTPFFFTVGNHDMYFDQSASYLAAFSLPTNSVSPELHQLDQTAPEHYYSFDHGDIHFTCLFVPQMQYYDFRPGSAQYEWLERDLASSRKKWKIIFQHVPVHTSGPHAYDDTDFDGVRDSPQLHDVLIPLANRYGVNVIFSGHDHMFERFAPDQGIHSVTTGAGGVIPLYGLSLLDPLSAKIFVAYHFTDVHVSGDTMTIKAVGTNNVVFDELVIQRAPPPPQVYDIPWAQVDFPDRGLPDGDGNLSGQRWPFANDSRGKIQSSSGTFANLGQLRFACDNTNLFVGLEKVMLPPGADLLLFLESPSLAGIAAMDAVGNRRFDPDQQGADGLDFLKNLGFTHFRPSIACIFGDEFADGTIRNFLRSGASLASGQGVFRLDSNLTSVPSAKIQQFNQATQIYPFPGEANADEIIVAIPLTALGSPAPLSKLRIAAIAAREISDTNSLTRDIDTGFVGASLAGSGTNHVDLEPLEIVLPADADPDHDGIRTETELALGTNPLNADSDGDGLMDLWEVLNQMDPNDPVGAVADPDGDVLTNLDEQKLGSNPRDPRSGITLQLRRLPDDWVELSWPGLVHTFCVVEVSDSPGGSFNPVAKVVPDPSKPGLFQIQGVGEAKFFRVRLQSKND